MIGALTGDIIGSVYEFHNIKTKEFELFGKRSMFTDDSVMSICVAKALLQWNRKGTIDDFKEILIDTMHEIGNKYPWCGYGGRFALWIGGRKREPYNSWGNGSAMRVSSCGFFANSLGEAQELAKASAEITHNHPEGIKGAVATASALYLARAKKSKEEIKEYIHKNYYILDFTLDEIRPFYRFNESCQDTVPQALECFFESTDFEDAMRNCMSIGGDSDTLGAICGGIAEAYYGIPDDIKTKALSYLDDYLLNEVTKFTDYMSSKSNNLIEQMVDGIMGKEKPNASEREKEIRKRLSGRALEYLMFADDDEE